MNTPSLFELPSQPYNGLPPSRDADTSRAAAARQAARAPSIRMIILAEIRRRGDAGITADEAGDWLAAHRGQPPGCSSARLTAAARITELKLGGLLADSGRRRDTSAGSAAIVWTATGNVGDGRICERH